MADATELGAKKRQIANEKSLAPEVYHLLPTDSSNSKPERQVSRKCSSFKVMLTERLPRQ